MIFKLLSIFFKIKIIATFTEAIQTIDPKLAIGKFHTLWIDFAKYYEQNNQLKDAESVYEKAVKINFKNVDELAAIWCDWAEMELRNK